MIEVKMQFTDAEQLIAFFVHGGMTAPVVKVEAPAPTPTTGAFFAAHGGTTAPVVKIEAGASTPKSAKAEKPAAIPPSAAPAPTPAAPETPPAASELPYPPIATRITEMIAVSNPNSAANRTALKALFAELSAKYGTEVKNGQAVKPEDRPALVAVLDGLAM